MCVYSKCSKRCFNIYLKLHVRCNTRALENNPRVFFEICRGTPQDTRVFVKVVSCTVGYPYFYIAENTPNSPSSSSCFVRLQQVFKALLQYIFDVSPQGQYENWH